jgi:hypothetical protein
MDVLGLPLRETAATSTDSLTSERRRLEPAAEAPADGCRERSQPLRYAIARSAACSIGPLG